MFRRFLQYVGYCVEWWEARRAGVLDPAAVRGALPTGVVAEERAMELAAILRGNIEAREQARRLLSMLSTQTRPLKQKQAATLPGMGEMRVSRRINRLTAYGFVTRHRSAGGNLLRLAV